MLFFKLSVADFGSNAKVRWRYFLDKGDFISHSPEGKSQQKMMIGWLVFVPKKGKY